MANRPHGRAYGLDSAYGKCDRCDFVYLLRDLAFQYDYRGNTLANIKLRVCPECYDKPYQGRRPLHLPPDPLPVREPRPINPLPQENAGPAGIGDNSTLGWDEPGILWDDETSEWTP